MWRGGRYVQLMDQKARKVTVPGSQWSEGAFTEWLIWVHSIEVLTVTATIAWRQRHCCNDTNLQTCFTMVPHRPTAAFTLFRSRNSNPGIRMRSHRNKMKEVEDEQTQEWVEQWPSSFLKTESYKLHKLCLSFTTMKIYGTEERALSGFTCSIWSDNKKWSPVMQQVWVMSTKLAYECFVDEFEFGVWPLQVAVWQDVLISTPLVFPLLLGPTDVTALISCPATYIPLLGSELSLSLHVHHLAVFSLKCLK